MPDPTASVAESVRWLATVWDHPGFAEALTFANPGLAAHVAGVVDAGDEVLIKAIGRATSAVSSYLVRWQRRATPFGLFAGVTTATLGPAGRAIRRATPGGGPR
ncbi:hypothetical protein FB565_002989 [Actinoplanes lutulentus]|uniref:lantibiotic dehydratase n=1 Tax=Actinoplanes lutulentus TaxID=1287878 RepID=UPI0015EBD4FC|nr:lantibiotic dehydratase [Actinoplanes lutulentus]MBB2943276.1 hypothetical protein [Actinoplanes lutulentus]